MIPRGRLEFSSITPQSHSKEPQNDMDYLYVRNYCGILCLNVGQKSNQEMLLEDLGYSLYQSSWNGTRSSVFQRSLVVKSAIK